MDQLLLLLAFMVGLIAGPFVVARLWPHRSRVTGNITAGECGSSPTFWGVTLGLALGDLVLSALILFAPAELASVPTRVILILFVFLALALLTAPLVICGFHIWKWNADGLERVGVFRRQSLRWKDVETVRRIRRTGWVIRTTEGKRLSTSNYVPGERWILSALIANRPEFKAQIMAALEDEKA